MICKCTHNAGFFSCCSVLLKTIIQHLNRYGELPTIIDSVEQFKFYKSPQDYHIDIRTHYFAPHFLPPPRLKRKFVNHEEDDHQFQNYKLLDYVKLRPFIDTYFRPSDEVSALIQRLLTKYDLTNPRHLNNTCVLFYRGNDKVKETELCTYQDMIDKAQPILQQYPDIRFLIQSDETEFFERMFQEFGNKCFCFQDEIRHMRKTGDVSLDAFGTREFTFHFSKWYLAITIIMSYCRHIICGSGNCSIWIMYYRGNADNVHQYLNGEWF